MSSGSARELEEERRLFYVAVTRAEKQATLSYALNRYKWGNLERCSPSRFLREIDQKFLHYPQTGGKPFQNNNHSTIKPASLHEEPHYYTKDERFKKISKSGASSDVPFVGSDSSLFAEGDKVEHERFGEGIIISIEGQLPNTTATVNFGKDGNKKLLLRFAKLKKL
jgi:DNA helicase-2/ATP-dependent DNA helicase PcrA